MPILLAGTTEFVHIEQVSTLFKFPLGQVLLYMIYGKQELYFLELFACKFVSGLCYWKVVWPSSPYLHVPFPLLLNRLV
jgi:hypothetical protein